MKIKVPYKLLMNGALINYIACPQILTIQQKNVVWVKKNNPDFDVTMGSFDGPEVCELVGL